MGGARIVGVHGVGQQLLGPELLAGRWLPALRDGLRNAGAEESALPRDGDMSVAFYGGIFRRAGTMGLTDIELTAEDVEPGEAALLEAWWKEAARVDPAVGAEGKPTMLATPSIVQRALNALSRSRFFVGVAEHALIWDLRQVRRYFDDPSIRQRVTTTVAGSITLDTRLLIAHSLGTVAAYEALCAHPEWEPIDFVSMGSPLGIRNLIFDRLDPAPVGRVGARPSCVRRWVNIADRGDVVALEKRLADLFEGQVQDVAVSNEARAHDAVPYLTAPETGAVIAGLLRS